MLGGNLGSLLYGDVFVMTVHLISSSVVSSVKNKDIVQPLHLFCLIRAYDVHCSDSAIPLAGLCTLTICLEASKTDFLMT